MNRIGLIGVLIFFSLLTIYSQPPDSAKIATMTRDEILSLSQDDLLALSMENLVFLAEKLGISIDELLNMKTSIASRATLTPRETPGVISIISEEEIRYSGARDLIDVLRLVPGFDFGYDVQGVIGAGLRGNWVHEGKILIMIDDQPLNDLSYSNTPFGNHIAVDQIKTIEIIRGPGSVIYGGNAELGVINIITKKGSDLKGVEVTGTYGSMQHSMGRENINVSSGFTVKDWEFSASGFLGNANRSDQKFIEYIDDHENTIDLSKGGNEIKTQQVNLSAGNDKLSLRLIYDDYKTSYNYFEDTVIGNVNVMNQFRTFLGELKYKFEPNDKLSIIPSFDYKFSRPYYEEDYWRNFQISRYTGTVIMNYHAGKKMDVISGIEYYRDRGRCFEDSGFFYSNGTPDLLINNVSAFAEGIYKTKKLNLIAGYRAEYNSIYGWASAPRIGLTGIFNRFHFKTLFSGAFRTPGIGNIDVANRIVPEESWVTEIEMGYRINDNMFLTANLYDIFINRSIIYFDNGGWDPGVDWGYLNANNSGSDGLELEFRAKYAKVYAVVNYSFYTQAFRNLPELYSVPDFDGHALGLSGNKIGINAGVNPLKNLWIVPSFTLLGKKYGYCDVDEDLNPVIGEFGSYYLLNLAMNYDNLFHKGINVSLSVFDLLNEKPPFIQPYNGGFYPYPGRSRELVLKLALSTDIFRN
ncbi:MAG TPA: TonB-dependent receptor [Bacteroidales bacterium]|nr:TonB-dependent receptor [Bacteroidales bacterium]